MQIEWSEGGVEKFAGVVQVAGLADGGAMGTGVDGGKDCRRGEEEDVWV
jgi:hypothetical protein